MVWPFKILGLFCYKALPRCLNGSEFPFNRFDDELLKAVIAHALNGLYGKAIGDQSTRLLWLDASGAQIKNFFITDTCRRAAV